MAELRCLVVDWGGVLTGPIEASWRRAARRVGLDLAQFDAVMAETLADPDGVVRGFEQGMVTEADFERYLAGRLAAADGGVVPAGGLLARLWHGMVDEPTMTSAVQRAREAGIRTALLSNSWGLSCYDRSAWDDLFDAVVISGEVGLRKPDSAIFQLAAARLAAEPAECVFVDDLPGNVAAAADVGMVGLHHVEPSTTIAELQALFAPRLR